MMGGSRWQRDKVIGFVALASESNVELYRFTKKRHAQKISAKDAAAKAITNSIECPFIRLPECPAGLAAVTRQLRDGRRASSADASHKS